MCFCNHSFLLQFPESLVVHLPRTCSDHHPLVVKEPMPTPHLGTERPFRMLAAWFTHPNFERIVRADWEQPLPTMDIMRRFKFTASTWNKFKFGNIFDRKQRCRARLGGIQKARGNCDLEFLSKLEESLVCELDDILEQEELLWRHKSRVSWLLAGERNTRFFHASTVIRRRQNRIRRLMDDMESGRRMI